MNPTLPSDSNNVSETEEQLVRTAETAISNCRWTVGECAAKWTKRYAKGRTDVEFGMLIGLSGDQVYQRRRVWETFSDVAHQFEALKWSHFYAAINWDDAAECLQWAEETHSTVAEMKAWRRASRGEDLTSEPEAKEIGVGTMNYLSAEPAFVQDPSDFAAGGAGNSSRGYAAGKNPSNQGDSEESSATLAGVARGLHSDDDYAPFNQSAIKPPVSGAESGTMIAEPRVSAEQLAKRICSTLERCTKALTPEYAAEFRKLPESLRKRLTTAATQLEAAVSRLR